MKQLIKKVLGNLFPQSQELYRNYEILERELQKVGQEYEQKSYQELLSPAEDNSTKVMIGDRKIYFSAEAYNIKPDGTLCFCIDAEGLPTLLGIKPSYHFYKRPDNSVYY